MTALIGVRVLDISSGGAGSLAAGLIADLGADVLKAVRDDPRLADPPVEELSDWLVWNRGKSLARMDPAEAGDRHALNELAASADVVIADSSAELLAHGITWSP